MNQIRVRGMKVRWRFLIVAVIVIGLLSGTGFPWLIEPIVLVAIATLASFVIAAWRHSRRATIAGATTILVVSWVLFYAPGAVLSGVELREGAFDRIHYAMSVEDVERLLGGPPGNYGRFSARTAIMTLEGNVGPHGSELLVWSDDDVRFEIAFADDRVVAKHERAGYGPSRSILSRIRRILEFRTIGEPRSVDLSRYPNGDPRPTRRPAPAPSPAPSKRIPIPRGRAVDVATPLSACTPKLVTFGGRGQANSIVAGSDGALWFAGAGGLGRRSVSGHTWAMSIGGADIMDIARGRDGAIWFSDAARTAIRRVSMDGILSEFPVPTRSGSPGPHAAPRPAGITLGKDGALWFVESSAGKLGRITTDGRITEYPLPDRTKDHSNPEAIVAASDGTLWFTQPLTAAIGRFDPTTQRFSEIPAPTDTRYGLGPTALAVGAGGVWFTLDTNVVGRIGLDRTVDTFEIPGAGTRAGAITVGADGNVWVLDHGLDRIVALDPDGQLVRTYMFNGIATSDVRDIDQARDDITSGPDGAIWFTLKDLGRISRIGCPL